jgi:hypothetical protein
MPWLFGSWNFRWRGTFSSSHDRDSNSFNKDIRMCIARHSDMQKPGVAGFSVEKNPDKSAHRRRESNYVQIPSQNTKGSDKDQEEMVLAIMQQKNLFAYAIRETWKLGDGLYEKNGFPVIQHGSDIKNLEAMILAALLLF